MDTTIHTYDYSAKKFAAATWEIRLDRGMDSFAAHLPSGAKILDLAADLGVMLLTFNSVDFRPSV